MTNFVTPPPTLPIRKNEEYLLFKNNRIRKHVTNCKTTHPLPYGRHKYMVAKDYVKLLKTRSTKWKHHKQLFFSLKFSQNPIAPPRNTGFHK